MNSINLCETHQAYIYIYVLFEELCARLRLRREMEQNYLYGPAFAIIFEWAKDPGAAVLNMLF